jgi:hypothetical protein
LRVDGGRGAARSGASRATTTLGAAAASPLPFGACGLPAGPQHERRSTGGDDARTGMPARVLAGAMCVQRFDGSLDSAIRITYRISLRSSSMPEPRDPLLKVLTGFLLAARGDSERLRRAAGFGRGAAGGSRVAPPGAARRGMLLAGSRWLGAVWLGNDPSAGSPTETLLRLLLPLNDRVWITSQPGVVVADLPGPVRKPH